MVGINGSAGIGPRPGAIGGFSSLVAGVRPERNRRAGLSARTGKVPFPFPRYYFSPSPEGG